MEQRRGHILPHQGHTVADFTCWISDWHSQMSRCGTKDEGEGPGPAARCGAVHHQQHRRRWRGLARFQHTPSKGRVKKKEPGAKSPFHNCSLTSRSRNENTLMRFVSSSKFGTSRVSTSKSIYFRCLSTSKSIYFRCPLAKQPHVQCPATNFAYFSLGVRFISM